MKRLGRCGHFSDLQKFLGRQPELYYIDRGGPNRDVVKSTCITTQDTHVHFSGVIRSWCYSVYLRQQTFLPLRHQGKHTNHVESDACQLHTSMCTLIQS